MNLLIVNDEMLTAETMKTDIEWKSYGIDEVYTAFDAGQARTVIQSQTVDIMLCDIEMPGDNGIELLRWVRNENLPIECIFLTCHPKFSYAQEAITLNSDSCQIRRNRSGGPESSKTDSGESGGYEAAGIWEAGCTGTGRTCCGTIWQEEVGERISGRHRKLYST